MTNASISDRAPIALFVYRRLNLTERVLDGLQDCDGFAQSPLYIFSDGPKRESDIAGVCAVRAMLQRRRTPNVTIVEAEANQGLSRSIISGVKRLCDEYGRVIVMEDDLIADPDLLNWFNIGLDRYADDSRVMQIAANLHGNVPLKGGAFLPLTTSWGWATWARAWQQFDPEASGWESLFENSGLRRKFDLEGAYPYSRMLKRQMRGELDSWAIRWYWSVFVAKGLVLYPSRSLVANVGTDEAATHLSRFAWLRRLLAARDVPAARGEIVSPAEVRLDQVALRRVIRGIVLSRVLG